MIVFSLQDAQVMDMEGHEEVVGEILIVSTTQA